MKNRRRHCPKCGSASIGYGIFDYDAAMGNHITFKATCYDCGYSFKEHYTLIYNGSEEDTDDPWDGPMSAPVTFGTLEDLKK